MFSKIKKEIKIGIKTIDKDNTNENKVDKSKFIGNNDNSGLNPVVNETAQFKVTNENAGNVSDLLFSKF